ncbi:PIG-L deacetylase family protein [Qipengyuania atrilutea]|uniref:PIG-L family deacetylase n=1 Tax=Qipengyuania atrilutea TaxID=2744473 RepID=A0A850HDQ2_9SPHN|nr:PIG-L family deacetylase [Actirhodobacter atriluteus]NVD45299.1 PIG-L family deacetylase [Actirhodobacter atriluteus]
MKRVLAVSPHLDDAVFSAGGTLAALADAGDEVTVLTCFTGNVAHPSGFALACQLDKGLDQRVDYMGLRRTEDVAACTEIGAQALHWPFLEAPHRGYESATALFAGRHEDDLIEDELLRALAYAIAAMQPDLIYGPMAVGNHVDHLAVRRALERTAEDVVWWEDYPYAMRETEPPEGIYRSALAQQYAERKTAATLCYESQLGFQFGGPEQARAALMNWRMEGFSTRRQFAF